MTLLPFLPVYWDNVNMLNLLTTKEVANLLRVSPGTIYSWRHRHVGPPAVRVGKHLRWRAEDISAWVLHQRELETQK